MASGLGKTLTAAFDIEQFFQQHPNARVLVLCHRENILLQNKYKLRKYFGDEYSYGMFTGSEKTTRLTDFTFATFQTMRDHREEFFIDAFEYIVVDEAHHSPAATYKPTIDYFETEFLLGLSGTPERMDGKDILEIYEQTLYSMDVYDGWNSGFLARVEYYLMLNDLNEQGFKNALDPKNANVKLSVAQLDKTIFSEKLEEEIVKSIYQQTADLDDPTMFVFCNSITQAESLLPYFQGKTAMIHSKQSRKANQAIIDRFYAGEIRTVLSIDMLNEGIDVPAANVVVFMRATDSKTVFMQQLCRGARIQDGKITMRVLDFVANIQRFKDILEMEETGIKRTEEYNNTHTGSLRVSSPIHLHIPAANFQVRRVDIEAVLRLARHWSSEEIVDAYYKASLEAGHWLSVGEIHDCSTLPTMSTIAKCCQSIASLRQLAIAKYGRPKQIQSYCGKSGARNASDQELIDDYLEASLAKGSWLAMKEINNHPNLPSLGSFYNRFKNLTTLREHIIDLFPWTIMLSNDGAVLTEDGSYVKFKDWTDEDYIDGYYRQCVIKGGWLTKDEIEHNDSLPGISCYWRRIGGVQTLRQRCQEKYGENIFKSAPDEYCGDYSDAEVLQLYHAASKKAGQWLSLTAIRKQKSLPSDAFYMKRFGSPDGLVKAAVEMFGDIYPREQGYTKDQTLQFYYEESCRHGRWLSQKDIKDDPYLSSMLPFRKYGGVRRMRMLAQKQCSSVLRK